jgi:hypothetical protein
MIGSSVVRKLGSSVGSRDSLTRLLHPTRAGVGPPRALSDERWQVVGVAASAKATASVAEASRRRGPYDKVLNVQSRS